tara:strand:- start:362 stop:1015 length:654 start_codon:yes stop_codon:yes gene_type:complete
MKRIGLWQYVLRVLCGTGLVLLAFSNTSAAEENKRGEQLFELCSQCHGLQGEGMALSLAPSIAGLELWSLEAQLRKFRDGARGIHHEDIAGMRMRPMSMWLKTDEDLVAVANYVSSLTPVTSEATIEGGDATKGKALYGLCQSCHGANGEGLQPLNAPKLTHHTDWYLKTQIYNFKTGIRGSNPKDTTGALMRPMAMALANDQAINDVISYIMTLSK